ncbi:Ribonuclease P protein component (fragment) [Sulfurovum sp. enrichment culture clone C5]|uniref:Ribonuclease P protein component n=1 Tax=Sulfurovum sp. enrichment culture clone C5 TaxID=497650 RepID=A0A0S4XQS4_9BACT
MGFVAGKKVGKAVQRNRAKRLMRALFIKNADLIKSGNYVFVAKPDILSESFLNLSEVFDNILKRFQLFK